MVKKKDDLTKKVEDLDDKLKRALADYHNLCRRVEERRKDWEDTSAARIIDKLLDVYGDLKRAEKFINNKGLTIAVSQFWASLESEGVSRINTQGQLFDPQLMDCVEVVAGEENTVVETIEDGYLLNSRVIRPAKVKVGKGENKNGKNNRN